MRCIAFLMCFALSASPAFADIAPPPPPRGKKYIAVTNSVAVEKSVKGYIFVTQKTLFRPAPDSSHLRVRLSEKPTVMPEAMRRQAVSLIAIPEEEVKKIKGEAAIDEAILKNKIPGMHRIDFESTDVVDEKYSNKTVSMEYTIKAIDAKGMTFEVKRDGKMIEKNAKPGDKPSDGETDQAKARWPLVGLFGAAAFVTLGLWFVRRRV